MLSHLRSKGLFMMHIRCSILLCATWIVVQLLNGMQLIVLLSNVMYITVIYLVHIMKCNLVDES